MKRLTLKQVILLALLLFSTGNAMADDEQLKPFVLVSKGPGTVVEKVEQAKAALVAGGLPWSVTIRLSDAVILIVTSDELKKNAADSEHGGFGAIRVSITKSKTRCR